MMKMLAILALAQVALGVSKCKLYKFNNLFFYF